MGGFGCEGVAGLGVADMGGFGCMGVADIGGFVGVGDDWIVSAGCEGVIFWRGLEGT